MPGGRPFKVSVFQGGMAGNSPVYSHGCKCPLPVAEGAGWKTRLHNPWQKTILQVFQPGAWNRMTVYGYARVSVREPEDKNLDLQVERLVHAGCSMGNVRAEEANGAKDDRGGLLELLDLVVEGDTLVVTHIDRLSRGLTYGLQVIEGPAPERAWSSGPCRRTFDTALRPPASSSSGWCSHSASGGGTRSGSARSPARRRLGPRGVSPAGWPSLTEQQRKYIRTERSKGVSQRELAKLLDVSRWTIQQVDG